MCDQFVEFFEAARIEQQSNALACGQLPRCALTLKALFAASQLSAPFEVV
jgi:hypothetical protein